MLQAAEVRAVVLRAVGARLGIHAWLGAACTPGPHTSVASPLQVLFPGLYILFERPFKFMALPALALVFFVTLVLIRLAPKSWIEDPPSYWRAFHVFKKVSITFFVYMVRCTLYCRLQSCCACSPGGSAMCS